MDNIYQETVSAVENGARFKVDFQMRSLKVDCKYVIRNSSYEGVLGVPHCSEEEFFSKVEELYRRYKHSIPSERSESTSRRYFMALPERELSDDDMLYGGATNHKSSWNYSSSANCSAASNGIPRSSAGGSGRAKKTRTW